MSKEKKKRTIEVLNPDAAGIDIGSESHYVCVPKERAEQNIREFKGFTSDLEEMAKWLKKVGIKTIAMESTGVYWIPVYQILERAGFEVNLVNARHVKNVPGRKTDVKDCQWLQELHKFGLLRGSFRPNDEICVLRSLVRQRDTLVRDSATYIQRMQKSLDQMNLKLHKVITDLTGLTGTKIIEAILNGERNADCLAMLKHDRVKSTNTEIAKALKGDYREEHIFCLKQAYDTYLFLKQKIAECDQKIYNYYQILENKENSQIEICKSKKFKSKWAGNPINFDARTELLRISGNDFTKIPGLDEISVQTIISEVGLNADKWKTEGHFASWLGLCPNHKITGGKIQSNKTLKVINRAALAFRRAALSLKNSKSALGSYYRRIRARIGAPKAITATAHKLSRIFYRMLKFGQQYIELGVSYYEQHYQDRLIKNLKRQASGLGFALVKLETSNCVS